ncbi:MAG: zinc ribbon domain-containing protein [Thermoplasmata archaeon]|nr:MAG: zinc ribbon domain-containing protein [Thermoplasmata archaeon]
MEKYCPSCYAVIDEDSSNCPVCGTRFDASPGVNRTMIISLVIVMALISASLLALFLTRPRDEAIQTAIELDGDFRDWSDVTSNSDPSEMAPFNHNVDIVDFRLDSRSSHLSFYIDVEGYMLAGEPGGEEHVDTVYIFIDADQNPDTGYFIDGIGADHMLEVYGGVERCRAAVIIPTQQLNRTGTIGMPKVRWMQLSEAPYWKRRCLSGTYILVHKMRLMCCSTCRAGMDPRISRIM